MTELTRLRRIIFKVILFLGTIQLSHQTMYGCDPNANCGCSINPAIVSKIVGGEIAGAETWSWVVSISLAGKFFCGGTILSESWVITAAHCVEGVPPSRITIYAGSILRWSGNQERIPARKVIHPNYNPMTFTNDIALLQLDYPLDLTDRHIKPICLKFDHSTESEVTEWPPINNSVVAVGWGRLNEYGSASKKLRQVTLKTIDRQSLTCKSTLNNWQVQFCAGASHEHKDTCQGDSGGPLMMFTSNRQWILVGITSYGYGCARAAYAGVYTRIAAFESWINLTTNGSYSNSIASSTYHRRTTILSANFLILFMSIFLFYC